MATFLSQKPSLFAQICGIFSRKSLTSFGSDQKRFSSLGSNDHDLLTKTGCDWTPDLHKFLCHSPDRRWRHHWNLTASSNELGSEAVNTMQRIELKWRIFVTLNFWAQNSVSGGSCWHELHLLLWVHLKPSTFHKWIPKTSGKLLMPIYGRSQFTDEDTQI